ncbi:Oligopeptide-binding protein OppA precursor [compost metagenome]
MNFRSEIIDTRYFKEDVIQAKKLLQEGLKEEGLTQLPSFSIIINEGHEEIAEAVINSWNKNLGITVGFEVQPWEDLLDNRLKLNYTMAKAAWAADYNDPSTFLDYFTSWSSDNDSGWSSALYDSYIKQARLTLDTSERNKLYAKAEKMLIDQMVILPLYYFYADVLHKPNIKKVSVEYDGSISFSRGYLI